MSFKTMKAAVRNAGLRWTSGDEEGFIIIRPDGQEMHRKYGPDVEQTCEGYVAGGEDVRLKIDLAVHEYVKNEKDRERLRIALGLCEDPAVVKAREAEEAKEKKAAAEAEKDKDDSPLEPAGQQARSGARPPAEL